MKYSFMSFSTPELSMEKLISTARRFGYQGVEPRIDSKHKHGLETDATTGKRKEIKKLSENSGIAFACIATSCVFANQETVKQNIEKTMQCIDLAADVGAPRLRVFGGQLGDGISRAEAIKLVADSLRSLADYASQHKITVCMETHDYWCDPEHVATIMKQVNHPAIAANWDVMHPVREDMATMDQAFQSLKPWIRHLHVHDATARTADLLPIGTGGYDHKRAIELLQTIPYDGFISGEWIGWKDHYDVHLPRELATLKSYEK